MRRIALGYCGLLALAACPGSGRWGSPRCDRIPQDVPQEVQDDTARSRALLEPWLRQQGEFVRVHDDALDVDWIAVEPGMAGMRRSAGGLTDPATLPLFVSYAFKARTTKMPLEPPREIVAGFTIIAGPDGPTPVAGWLARVGPEPATGGPGEDRTLYGCPEGGTVHYASLADGTSPCHQVPLQPLYRCGCEHNFETLDPTHCAKLDLPAIPKRDGSACR